MLCLRQACSSALFELGLGIFCRHRLPVKLNGHETSEDAQSFVCYSQFSFSFRFVYTLLVRLSEVAFSSQATLRGKGFKTYYLLALVFCVCLGFSWCCLFVRLFVLLLMFEWISARAHQCHSCRQRISPQWLSEL